MPQGPYTCLDSYSNSKGTEGHCPATRFNQLRDVSLIIQQAQPELQGSVWG